MEVLDQLERVLPRSPRRVPGWVRAAVVPLVVAVVAAGVWVTGGLLTDDEALSKGATAVWFGVAALLATVVALRWRPLATPVLGSYAVAVIAIGGFLLWSSTVDHVVVEDVLTVDSTELLPAPADPTTAPAEGSEPAATDPAATTPAATIAAPPAPPAADRPTLLGRGSFRSGEHSTTGVAAVIRRPSGGLVVTLTRLDTSPGPDLRVYLVPGDGADVRGALDLGRLRGNKGTQQYDVPAGTDAGSYGAVVIWCRSFSVAFGTATLTPA